LIEFKDQSGFTIKTTIGQGSSRVRLFSTRRNVGPFTENPPERFEKSAKAPVEKSVKAATLLRWTMREPWRPRAMSTCVVECLAVSLNEHNNHKWINSGGHLL